MSSWVVCHCCLSRIERAIERVGGWIVEVGEGQSVDGGVVRVTTNGFHGSRSR